MAVVPTYERQVKAAPAPGPYQTASGATPDAFGAGVARAQGEIGKSVGQLGDQLYDYAKKKEVEDNSAQARQLDVEYALEAQQILHGPDGYFSLSKHEAQSRLGEYQERLEQAGKNALDKASNDGVRRVLGASIGDRSISYNGTVMSHYSKEKTAGQISDSDAKAAVASADGATFYEHPDRLEKEKVRSDNATLETSRLKGRTTDAERKQDLEAARGVFTSGAVYAALEKGNTRRATEILNLYGAEIHPKIRLTLAGQINEKTTTAAAVNLLGEAANAADLDERGLVGSERYEFMREYIERAATGKLKSQTIVQLKRDIELTNSLDRMGKTERETKEHLRASKTLSKELEVANASKDPVKARDDIWRKIQKMPDSTQKDELSKLFLERKRQEETMHETAGNLLLFNKKADEAARDIATTAMYKGHEDAMRKATPSGVQGVLLNISRADKVAMGPVKFDKLVKIGESVATGHLEVPTPRSMLEHTRLMTVPPAELRKIPDIGALRSEFTGDQFKDIDKRWTKAKQDGPKAEAAISEAAPRFENLAERLRLSGNKPIRGATQIKASMKEIWNNLIEEKSIAKEGAPLTDTDLREVEHNVLRKRAYGRSTSFVGIPYNANVTERADQILRKMDPERRKKITYDLYSKTGQHPKAIDIVREATKLFPN